MQTDLRVGGKGALPVSKSEGERKIEHSHVGNAEGDTIPVPHHRISVYRRMSLLVVRALEFRNFLMFLDRIEITHILPCLGDSAKIRFRAEFDTDVSEVLPYLNAVLDHAIYNHKGHTLTIKKEGRLITIHPRMIAGGQILHGNDARRIVEWVKDLINECYEERDTIKPLYERRRQLTALDLYKLLPGTNCGKCGELTCLAFAVKLQSAERNVMACDELFSGQFTDKRDELLRLLRSAGYAVPNVFLGEESEGGRYVKS